jgi:alcohol dehydrogenase, propanol-preferring
MRTMHAYRIIEWERPAQLVEVPVPQPGPGEVLVKVAANGLCHSDITMTQIPGAIGEALGWSMPFTLGHEIGGWIDSWGPGVDGYTEGQAVALVSPSSCGHCHACLRGRDNACTSGGAGRGYGRDGGLAHYVLAPAARAVVPIGSLDPVAAAPLMDAGATSYHAVKRALAHATPGGTAVVLGAGGLGSFAVQFLRALTACEVVAVDTNPARLDYAIELGAHHSVVGVDGDTTSTLRRLTSGEGADIVLDFVGVDASIEAGIASVRPGGAFGLIGAAGGTLRRGWYGGLPRDGVVFHFQGSDIADAHEVLSLAERGVIRSDTDRFDLDDVTHAYAAMESGSLRGRAVVLPRH